MTKPGHLTSSTLKPVPDKWIALDGVHVVLHASQDEMIVLRYEGTEWAVTKHRSRDASEPVADEWLWHGTRYDPAGAPLARLSDHDPPERWKLLYRELLAV